VSGIDWNGTGDGGFDPTKRIWYLTGKPELIENDDEEEGEGEINDFEGQEIQEMSEFVEPKFGKSEMRMSTMGTVLLFVFPMVLVMISEYLQK
jgi:hypothetical protein